MNIKCKLGAHDIPKNGIVSHYGAIRRGGYCARCDQVIYGKIVYNAWGKEEDKGHCIELTGTNPQLTEDIESGKYVWGGRKTSDQQLRAELYNAQVRISDRDLKIERQRVHVTKLELSRKGLKTENAALKEHRDQLLIDNWEIAQENATLKRYAAHKPECTHWEPFAGDPSYIGCNCGLDALFTAEEQG